MQESLEPVLQPPPPSFNSFLYFAAAIVNLIGLIVGISSGWSSPVISKLQNSPDNPLGRTISYTEASWLGSLLQLGAIWGPLLAGKSANKFGRKPVLLLVSVPLVGSFLMIAFARSIYLYFVARFIMGVGVGSIYTVLPVYLGEIAEDSNRGAIGCFLGVAITLGILYAYSIAPFVSIKIFSFLCLTPFIVFIPVFAFVIPDSPDFYAMVKDDEKFEKSLRRFRAQKTEREISTEIEEIQLAVLGVASDYSLHGGYRTMHIIRKHKNLQRAIVITSVLAVLEQVTGIEAIIAYMQPIFESSTKTQSLSEEVMAIIVASLQAVTTVLVASAPVDHFGRRYLLLGSLSGCCFSLVILATYFQVQPHTDLAKLEWVPLFGFIVFILAFNCGIGLLTWTIMGELFTMSIKSCATTLTTVICFATSFAVTLSFPIVTHCVGISVMFWIFAACCALGILFVYFVVPETKRKSVSEIQMLLLARQRR